MTKRPHIRRGNNSGVIDPFVKTLPIIIKKVITSMVKTIFVINVLFGLCFFDPDIPVTEKLNHWV